MCVFLQRACKEACQSAYPAPRLFLGWIRVFFFFLQSVEVRHPSKQITSRRGWKHVFLKRLRRRLNNTPSRSWMRYRRRLCSPHSSPHSLPPSPPFSFFPPGDHYMWGMIYFFPLVLFILIWVCPPVFSPLFFNTCENESGVRPVSHFGS